MGAEEFAGCGIGGCVRTLPSELPANGGPTAGEAGASRGAKHRSRRARTLRVIMLGHVVEETDVENVNLDTGGAGHHAWRTSKPATSLRGGPGGASRRIGRNESKVGIPAWYVVCGDSVASMGMMRFDACTSHVLLKPAKANNSH